MDMLTKSTQAMGHYSVIYFFYVYSGQKVTVKDQ